MKRVTTTTKVLEALENDILTLQELLEKTQEQYNRVTAALFSLKNYYNAITEQDGLYMATPENDTRLRRVEYREEEHGRNRKCKKEKHNADGNS